MTKTTKHLNTKEIEDALKEGSVSKEQLHTWFKEELERKDEQIAKLKKENDVLFRTALKAKQQK